MSLRCRFLPRSRADITWGISVLTAALSLLAPVSAQGQPAPGQAPAASPQNPSSAPAPADKDARPAPVLGQIQTAEARVLCWPSANSPAFEDKLKQGLVVALLPADAGFRRVLLPLGPVGFVHKKYVGEPQDGRVKTKGKGVSLRYRPRTGEAPVDTLKEGTELLIVAEKDGEWWQVRGAEIAAFVAEADVQVLAAPTPEQQAAVAELLQTEQAEVDGWLKAVADKQAQAAVDAEQTQKLAGLQERVRGEGQKNTAAQQWQPIAEAITTFAKELAAESPLQGNVKALQQSVENRKWVVEATAVRDTEPVPPKDLPQLQADVKDALDRFITVGWLRWERGLVGPGQFVIEKGDQRLYVVTCNNGRYDLAMFVGKEVGLIGPRRRPGTESMRVLDVEKIEVLGLPR